MKGTRLAKYQRRTSFEIEVEGVKVTAYDGETIATILLAAGMRTFNQKIPGEQPNRLYCEMGVCMQCLVTIDGIRSCQACRTLVQPGMKVEFD